jgi:CDP-glycerol glycerophosphotransferase
MKIDRSNPRHWWYLGVSLLWVVFALCLRPLRTRRFNNVILYGHKFNGNLKALSDYFVSRKDPKLKVYFLTLDVGYGKELEQTKTSAQVLFMTRFRDMLKVGQGDVIITDHGLHTLTFINKFTSIKFVDVWHGIPYKGFVPKDLAPQHSYTEVWVSSPWMRDVYIKDYGFQPSIVKVTGYARVDRLVNNSYSVDTLRKKYGISPEFKKIVLVAPTWQQDDKGRSIVPFGVSEADFFKSLNNTAKKLRALIIFRAHLNVDNAASYQSLPHVKNMPYVMYPDAEEFLAISDVLVTDWSSVAFDFLPTRRPVIYLDVKAPFKNGFTIGPKYRFGDVVSGLQQLSESIVNAVNNPDDYKKKYAAIMDETGELAYGDNQDGQTCERSYKRLEDLLRST